MPSVTKSLSASGELVAAPPAGQFIKVIGYQVSSAGQPGLVKLQSGATTDEAQMLFFTATGGQTICPPIAGNSEPYFLCNPGENLYASLGSAVATAFNIQYVILGR